MYFVIVVMAFFMFLTLGLCRVSADADARSEEAIRRMMLEKRKADDLSASHTEGANAE